MSFSSYLQIVKLENEKGVSIRTKKPYDFMVAQCVLLDENGAPTQSGRMMVPESLRPVVKLDVYQAGFALTVAGMGQRKGEVVPRLLSLTSLTTGEIAKNDLPTVQAFQILKIDDLKTGVSEGGREWSRLNCEVMLLEPSGNGKFVAGDVGRIAVPESLRDGLRVGSYTGGFSLGVPTFGDEKQRNEVSARLVSLTPIQGGLRIGLPAGFKPGSAPPVMAPAAEAAKV